MSRRKGQDPEVRMGTRANGEKYYYFQLWIDVPEQKERKRITHVIGLTSEMTPSEAERKKLEFITNLKLNSSDYQIPSSATFGDAIEHYRNVFSPRYLRDSTRSVALGHIKNHLESDWKAVPLEHITIETVNEWIWKKREQGLGWVTIKNILRTLQRVCTCDLKGRKPPFSQKGLAIPQKDKLEMKIQSRKKVSYSWEQTEKIAKFVRKMDSLGDSRRKQYSTLFLVENASGLRPSEMLALRVNDIDFKGSTIRVDESSDQKGSGKIGPCKNPAAYRTVLLRDPEGQKAMKELRKLVGPKSDPIALVFRSKSGKPLWETNILNQCLYPALKALGFEKSGMHAFRRGCNRRWDLAGINPAVIRQQMGHSSATMTALYSGEIPLDRIRAEFSSKFGKKKVDLEKMENEVAA